MLSIMSEWEPQLKSFEPNVLKMKENFDSHRDYVLSVLDLLARSTQQKVDNPELLTSITMMCTHIAWTLHAIFRNSDLSDGPLNKKTVDLILSQLSELLSHNKNNPDYKFCFSYLKYIQSVVLRGRGQISEAEREARIAILYLPDTFKQTLICGHMRNEFGLPLMYQGNLDGAEKQFLEALKYLNAPEQRRYSDAMAQALGDLSLRTNMNLAQLYSRQEKHELAVKYAADALDSRIKLAAESAETPDTDHSIAYNYMVLADAELAFAKALKIENKLEESIDQLRHAYGNASKAIELYQKHNTEYQNSGNEESLLTNQNYIRMRTIQVETFKLLYPERDLDADVSLVLQSASKAKMQNLIERLEALQGVKPAIKALQS